MHGRERVARAVVGVVAKFWGADATTEAALVNGRPGILARTAGGDPIAVLTVVPGPDGIAEILWQVNPEKLARFAVTS